MREMNFDAHKNERKKNEWNRVKNETHGMARPWTLDSAEEKINVQREIHFVSLSLALSFFVVGCVQCPLSIYSGVEIVGGADFDVATKRRNDHPFRIISIPEFSAHKFSMWTFFFFIVNNCQQTSFWFGRCITRSMGNKDQFIHINNQWRMNIEQWINYNYRIA